MRLDWILWIILQSMLISALVRAESHRTGAELGEVLITSRDELVSRYQQGMIIDRRIAEGIYRELSERRQRVSAEMAGADLRRRYEKQREAYFLSHLLAKDKGLMDELRTHAMRGGLLTDQQVAEIIQSALGEKRKLDEATARQLKEWRADRLAHVEKLKRNRLNFDYFRQADNLNQLFPALGKLLPELGTRPFDTARIEMAAAFTKGDIGKLGALIRERARKQEPIPEYLLKFGSRERIDLSPAVIQALMSLGKPDGTPAD